MYTRGATATSRARPRNKCGSNACAGRAAWIYAHTVSWIVTLSQPPHKRAKTRAPTHSYNMRCDNINNIHVCVCVNEHVSRFRLAEIVFCGRRANRRNSRFTIAFPRDVMCGTASSSPASHPPPPPTAPSPYKLYAHSDPAGRRIVRRAFIIQYVRYEYDTHIRIYYYYTARYPRDVRVYRTIHRAYINPRIVSFDNGEFIRIRSFGILKHIDVGTNTRTIFLIISYHLRIVSSDRFYKILSYNNVDGLTPL